MVSVPLVALNGKQKQKIITYSQMTKIQIIQSNRKSRSGSSWQGYQHDLILFFYSHQNPQQLVGKHGILPTTLAVTPHVNSVCEYKAFPPHSSFQEDDTRSTIWRGRRFHPVHFGNKQEHNIKTYHKILQGSIFKNNTNMQHDHVYQRNRQHPNHNDFSHASGNIVLYPTLNRGDRTSSLSCWIPTTHQQHRGGNPHFPISPIHSSGPKTPPFRPTRMVPPRHLISPPHPRRITSSLVPCLRYERIGNPSLRIFRLQLPSDMIYILDDIIAHSERHVNSLPDGWKTELYSLTKQDYALRDIPGMSQRIRPIHDYICKSIQILYGCRKVAVDKNQPHILKYSQESGHTGVELHHDRCDVTANLALSKSKDYQGGGTCFPDIGRVIRLEQGEFLLHPGSLVHGGMDVSAGSRYLMVTFAHLH